MDEINAADNYRNWKNPIDGNEIMERYGIPGCKLIAEIKDSVKEAILEGIIENSHDAALKFADKLALSKRAEIESLGGNLRGATATDATHQS